MTFPSPASLLNSPEFAIAARVGAVLGAPLALLAGIIFWDIRDDVKTTKNLLIDTAGIVRVHEQIVADHGRRLNERLPAIDNRLGQAEVNIVAHEKRLDTLDRRVFYSPRDTSLAPN